MRESPLHLRHPIKSLSDETRHGTQKWSNKSECSGDAEPLNTPAGPEEGRYQIRPGTAPHPSGLRPATLSQERVLPSHPFRAARLRHRLADKKTSHPDSESNGVAVPLCSLTSSRRTGRFRPGCGRRTSAWCRPARFAASPSEPRRPRHRRRRRRRRRAGQ